MYASVDLWIRAHGASSDESSPSSFASNRSGMSLRAIRLGTKGAMIHA